MVSKVQLARAVPLVVKEVLVQLVQTGQMDSKDLPVQVDQPDPKVQLVQVDLMVL